MSRQDGITAHIEAISTLPCIAWRRPDGSAPSGPPRRISGGHASTRSPRPAENNWRTRNTAGPRSPPPSGRFWNKPERGGRMSWISRIANALRPERTAADLDDELQFHLERRAADLANSGTPFEEAELLARRRLGSPLRLSESSREVKSAAWLESLLRDFRFGLRMLAKYRTASLAAIASLALAIGACTSAFTLIDALILGPIPLQAPRQLIDIARVMPAFLSPDNQPSEWDSFSYPQYELIRDTARDRADLFAMRLSGGLQPALFDDA